MTLQEYIDSLPQRKQLEIAVKLLRLALPIWNDYANHNKLTYHDTVVGMQHWVDKRIIANVLDVVEGFILTGYFNRQEVEKLKEQFDDPIVSLHDLDWILPYDVVNLFFASYNLLNSLIGIEKTAFNETTIYVSVNQMVDLLTNSGNSAFEELKEIVYFGRSEK